TTTTPTTWNRKTRTRSSSASKSSSAPTPLTPIRRKTPSMRTLTRLFLLLSAAIGPAAAAQTAPLKVIATTPDLGSLVHEVGGDAVALTVLAKPTEDPHFLEAKPSYIKAASEADLFIQTGMELEMGWAPPIIANSRNDRIQPSARGFLKASRAIT